LIYFPVRDILITNIKNDDRDMSFRGSEEREGRRLKAFLDGERNDTTLEWLPEFVVW
jgi:hypothetical protein